MIKSIMNHLKGRKFTVLLILLGFFIASFVLSIGISIVMRNVEYYQDQTIGGMEKQLFIVIDNKKEREVDVKDLIYKISCFGEVQLINYDKVCFNKDGIKSKYQVVPVSFEKSENWNIPLIQGNYFEVEDMKNNCVILGKKIAQYLNLAVGDCLKIDNKEYKVSAIAGREYRETQWDNVAYVPFSAFFEQKVEKCVLPSQKLFQILLKSGKDSFINQWDTMKQLWNEKGLELSFEELEGGMDSSAVKNSITLTGIFALFVFLIAIINISNLMLYWIYSRKEELGVMKAIGGTNAFISRNIVIEVVAMAILGALLAIIFQQILSWIIHNSSSLGTLEIPLEIHWVNILISLGIALIVGIISSVWPARLVIKMEPAKILMEGRQ